MSRLAIIYTMQIAFAAACISVTLASGQSLGATTQAPSSDTSQDADAERVKITTDFVRDCVSRREVTAGGGDISQRVIACVNARAAKEGKPWRWNPGPADITIEKK